MGEQGHGHGREHDILNLGWHRIHFVDFQLSFGAPFSFSSDDDSVMRATLLELSLFLILVTVYSLRPKS